MKKDKLYQEGTCLKYVLSKKLWRIMKLTGLLVMFSFMVVSASTYSQNTRFSFELEKKSLHDFFLFIEENSEFKFAYNKATLDDERTISIDCQDETIEQILDKVLDDEGLRYKVIDNYIIISGNEDSVKTKRSNLSQQKKKVTGSVKDSNGMPLPGVSVVIKGTTNGTISDFDGNFVITDVPGNGILVFSFVGMSKQEVDVTGLSTIDLVMEEDAIGIEEVVETARQHTSPVADRLDRRSFQPGLGDEGSGGLENLVPGLQSGLVTHGENLTGRS